MALVVWESGPEAWRGPEDGHRLNLAPWLRFRDPRITKRDSHYGSCSFRYLGHKPEGVLNGQAAVQQLLHTRLQLQLLRTYIKHLKMIERFD